MLTMKWHQSIRNVLALAAFAWMLTAPFTRAEDKSPNASTGRFVAYEADPHWPQRPSHDKWGHIPGIAVDKNDQTLFADANPGFMVLDFMTDESVLLRVVEAGRGVVFSHWLRPPPS